jgi:hypothetical protein
MTYQSCNAFLEPRGRLGFLITQSVFKTGAGEGFRQFALGDGTRLRVVHVDDLTDFQPFEHASNRTSVMILEKGRQTRYPVPYTVWQKVVRGKNIGFDESLEEASRMTRRLRYVAEPVDQTQIASQWITARPRTIRALRKMLGASAYVGRNGVSAGLNGVYWLQVLQERPGGMVLVQNIVEGTKKSVRQVQTILEEGLLFPLVRGNEVGKWVAAPSTVILLTHLKGERLNAIACERMQREYPKTWGYLKEFEAELRSRAIFKRYFTRRQAGHVVETGPFYSLFNIGDYTFSRHKVVWGRIGSDIRAAAVGPVRGKPVVPQETHTMVAVGSRGESTYLAAVLNSLPFNFAVRCFSQTGGKSFASPQILERIRVPLFDPRDARCESLSTLGEAATRAKAQGTDRELERVSAKIDEAVLGIWDLSQADMREIDAGYREMTKADLGGRPSKEEDEPLEEVEAGE